MDLQHTGVECCSITKTQHYDLYFVTIKRFHNNRKLPTLNLNKYWVTYLNLNSNLSFFENNLKNLVKLLSLITISTRVLSRLKK